MKKSVRHLKHRQKIPIGKLSTTLIVVGALVVLGIVFAFYLTQQKPPPKPAVSQTPPETAYVLPPLPARFLGCPLVESICKSADFSTHVKNSSFSATLKENTPLLAVFDGKLKEELIAYPKRNGGRENLILLTITNQKQKLMAEYYFKGQSNKKDMVKEGEIIATSSGQPIDFFEGKSLVFVVFGLTAAGDSGLEPLAPANFK
ncbi:hypothetical protein A3D83_00250 [Candidatus Daviesbacteria bacterium RIFCSPHIGHO2_02_FULL_41_10]|uniref:Peptidase M23 domain-containing protein n=2 Tax=Candidatus Daviesiibacteriota TaxID=1752718 RepID=A0A1F5ISK7_9BACT|nr:MAG: hypothetical protein A2871_00640 [Candidatus Daviesbacteria bacterium RIFCSPHIGHO2_01_FULL_41_23]OGE33412.1 MAG: hypothetical protein A3D83_00250 [Candidatus Daviesbacteria bacterium RIFCSPHIGHO2_02_FULL_41_10]OGE62402.1 MAG: hypothetical protein A2967_01130 [Candidatus Daviesbacteria bacterium RIFCSPLOWO2_01_FULL_41_32]